jgi:hypothetical protein
MNALKSSLLPKASSLISLCRDFVHVAKQEQTLEIHQVHRAVAPQTFYTINAAIYFDP